MTLVDGESAMNRAFGTAADASGTSTDVRMRRAGQKEKGLSILESTEKPSSRPPGRVMPRLSRFRSGWMPDSLTFAPRWGQPQLPSDRSGRHRASFRAR